MMLVTARHCSSVMFSNACSARTAALLTRMSTPPKRAAAAATIFCTAAPSATSAVTPSALPPARSISPATASASLRLERTLTTTAAPPSASASAMPRPILRPAPVTMATRPASSLVMDSDPQVFLGGMLVERGGARLCRSPAQGGKIELAVIQRPQERQRPLRTRGVPSAVAGIEHEFLLDVAAGERLVCTAAQVRLALLDHAAVGKQRADMPGEIVGIRILRIDLVAHLRRKREHVRLPHRVVGEGIEPDLTAHERMGDAIRRGEFAGIAVGGALLDRERLPQPMHRAFADLAHELLDLIRLDPAHRQTPRAIDVGMRHRSARIGLEGERLRHPLRAEIADQRIIIARRGMGEAVKQPVHALEYGARAEKTVASQQRRAQPGLRRPARM